MEYQELRMLFNKEFGLHNPWPETWEVDPETYANICQAIFNHYKATDNLEIVKIALGKHGGIMFKNVELILKEKPSGKVSEEV